MVTKTKISTKTKTNAEMTAMTNTEVGLEKDTASLRKVRLTTSQN